MSCKTFDGMTVRDAARIIIGDDDTVGVRTCRTVGSWAYRNGIVAYSVEREGEVYEYYCADCAEARILALAESRPDYVIGALITSEPDLFCECGEDLSN